MLRRDGHIIVTVGYRDRGIRNQKEQIDRRKRPIRPKRPSALAYLQARCLAVQVVRSGFASHFIMTLPRALPPKLVID